MNKFGTSTATTWMKTTLNWSQSTAAPLIFVFKALLSARFVVGPSLGQFIDGIDVKEGIISPVGYKKFIP